jgi:DNA-binding CsgD family transcriptional regulator
MGMLDSDPAYPIVMSIVRVVPAARWSFARVGATGNLSALLASDPAGDDLAQLGREFKRQRKTVKSGQQIAAAVETFGDFESGITLIFADAGTTFGILTLLRKTENGLFTSTEVAMLTFALESVSERLSALRRHLQTPGAIAERHEKLAATMPAEPLNAAWYVLDREYSIVLSWTSDEERRVAMTGLRTRIADRLPAVLEESVRDLTAEWDRETAPRAGVAQPVPFLIVRTQPMTGPAGLFIGVRIDRFQAPDSLSDAAVRFNISARELQVFALLLDGHHLDEIGSLLHITSSTVQDHIKSMVTKTGSRNRSELIGHVLGWQSKQITREA